MRCIGKGQSSADMLCGILNLPNVPRVNRYVNILLEAANKVCAASMKRAAEESVALNDGNRDICIAVDGSWQKRGHTSLNGLVTATNIDTGKVLDYEVLSKHCRCKRKCKNKHTDKCEANYAGVSGGMEAAGVKTIFERSVSLHKLRYTQFLGDGDSKAFNAVSEAKVCGDECPITKLERVGHVQKRMPTTA